MTTLTAPFDTMTLAEHVAFCRGLRVQYANQWGESELPENKHGDGGVVGHAGKCETASEAAGAGLVPSELPASEPRPAREMDSVQGQTGASVVGESDGDTSWLNRGSALTAEGPQARSNRARRQPTIPTNPDFWRDLKAWNEAHEKPVEEQGKHSHYRRSVNWLMHPGNCDGDCGPRKIRWMCAQPEESHAGRAGRRLAKVYGVEVR